MPPLNARILRGCTPEQYHGDPCARPSLSASIATRLVTDTPYHAWVMHPRLGGAKSESTPTKDNGTLVHRLVLGAGAPLRVIDHDDWRTKDAKASRQEAIDRGELPVLRDDHADALEVAASTKRGLELYGIRLAGQSEVVVVWEEQTHYGPIECRAMIDHLVLDAAFILDLKTCRSANPQHTARAAYEYGYDIQREAYTRAVRALRPDIAGRERFVFAFVEELPSGARERVLVTPMEFNGAFREMGKLRWERAVQQWAQCMHTGKWPAYATDGRPVQLEPPAWALAQEM